MPYLLDTHVFLWMAADPARLSDRVRKIVACGNNLLYLSAASGWEIALLRHLGRVDLPDETGRFVPEAMQRLRVTPLTIGFPTAISAAELPSIHRDPFDRLLIAEAVRGKMTILTKDCKFSEYGVPVVW